jgi:hypothetical protein
VLDFIRFEGTVEGADVIHGRLHRKLGRTSSFGSANATVDFSALGRVAAQPGMLAAGRLGEPRRPEHIFVHGPIPAMVCGALICRVFDIRNHVVGVRHVSVSPADIAQIVTVRSFFDIAYAVFRNDRAEAPLETVNGRCANLQTTMS